MPTSKEDISNWFDEGRSKNATHLIVATDTFDWDDYPVYVKKAEDVEPTMKLHNNPLSMNRVTEVYDLSLPKEEQLAEFRAWHVPAKVV